MEEIDRADNIRIDDMTRFLEVLIEKSMAETVARVGKQSFNRSASRRGIEFINALGGGEIDLEGIDRHPELA